MANTEYEHAGNSDQLRSLQLGLKPRCTLCHFQVGAASVPDAEIVLSKVTLPDGTDTLFCQFCIDICQQTGDGDFTKAATMIRPLPEENANANKEVLAIVDMAEKTIARVMAKQEISTPAFVRGTGVVYIKDKDGNDIVLGKTGDVSLNK